MCFYIFFLPEASFNKWERCSGKWFMLSQASYEENDSKVYTYLCQMCLSCGHTRFWVSVSSARCAMAAQRMASGFQKRREKKESYWARLMTVRFWLYGWKNPEWFHSVDYSACKLRTVWRMGASAETLGTGLSTGGGSVGTFTTNFCQCTSALLQLTAQAILC